MSANKITIYYLNCFKNYLRKQAFNNEGLLASIQDEQMNRVIDVLDDIKRYNLTPSEMSLRSLPYQPELF